MTSIWLQSHAAYNKVMRYGPIHGDMTEFSREDLDDSLETVGMYAHLSSVFVAFYCWNDGLFITIDAQQIRVDETLSAEIPKDKSLIISRGGAVLIRLRYALEEQQSARSEPSEAFIDDEDFDFGLLLARIIQSPKRQSVLLW